MTDFEIIDFKCQKCGCETAKKIPTENGTGAMCTNCMNITRLDYIKTSSIQITCPYCQSTNTTKITTTSKAVNTVMFGLLGTKRHKQWHCNNCKSDF